VNSPSRSPICWSEARLDAAAFAGGLALAWFAKWETTDLVWSLWLLSLVVGYATIGWSIFGPAVFVGTKAWQVRQLLGGVPVAPAAGGVIALLIGGVFLLAFFTVHFGMFHFVHSMFLEIFFPVTGRKAAAVGPQAATYFEVVKRYWIFLPMAFLAGRQAFRLAPPPAEPPDTAVTPEAIAARKARNAKKGNLTGLMAPYKNVVRMHLLIFFFAGAHFAGLENFFVYAVVYAVYFFPWRLLRKAK
jgi:hypothetical protein